MKQFLKYTLATILGIMITSLLLLLLFFTIVGFVASSSEKATKLKANTVYEIKLEGILEERVENGNLPSAIAGALNNDNAETIGLDEILSGIKKAKEDPNISGIYLNGGTLQGGIASIKEIRDALLDFKKSHKFIVSYAGLYTQKMYYLASVSDEILINPVGAIDLKGLSLQTTFYKNTLDKLGVDMQIVRVGKFKSAVEPFTSTEMSPENKEQVGIFLGSIWSTISKEIATSRKIPVDSINRFADSAMTFQSPEVYLKKKLIDKVVYIQSVDSIIRHHLKIKNDKEDISFVSTSEINKVPSTEKEEKDKIAVVYAVGEIGDISGEGIVEGEMVKLINDIAEDSVIKAVVLRVNSPGGSAYSSEQIWHALSLLKKKKPVVVSMGDYAASGGYYISCNADYIVAQPTTITGSIGIFGIIPNFRGLYDKIGISNDVVNTNKLSDAINTSRPFKPEERILMQAEINRGYSLFVKRCADGRKMSTTQITNIAEGHVWTGNDAFRIGLVDKLGGLNDAITVAAHKAKIEKYNIETYPEQEDLATRIIKNLGKDVETRMAKAQLGENYKTFKTIQQITKRNGIQTRMTYDISIY